MASITEQAPKIAKLWHPDKNEPLLPSSVPAFRKTKYWWQCSLGHDFEARPADLCRKPDASPCPFCIGRRVLIGFNDLSSQRALVAKEWHPNKNIPLTSDSVSFSSSKKVWWLGECGHEWQDVISERTRTRRDKPKGCRICNGIVATSGISDLSTTHPEIAKLWHPTRNKVAPINVMAGARMTKYWWLGECGHEWETYPSRMTSKYRIGSGCPYCCGKKLLVGFNDFATTQPHLLKEWHPIKNSNASASAISQWANILLWWKCSKNENHEWEAKVRDRSKGSGCPKCGNKNSKPEKELYLALSEHYLDAENGTRLKVQWGKTMYSHIDILIPSLKTVIEYDGWWWHKNNSEKDRAKTQALLDAGYKVIRVRISPLPFLDMKHENLMQVAANHGDDAKELADKLIKIFS